MRILAIAVGAALALATPALASGVSGDGFGTTAYSPPLVFGLGVGVGRIPTNHPLPLQHRYDRRVMALKAKMARLTTQDGGQLSAADHANLQRELDGVNHWFGLKPAQGQGS
jgi:hypothetical protein